MLRTFPTVALPVLLPFLLYGFYLQPARRKARQAGAGIAAAGVAFTCASLVVFGLTSGVEPGTRLAPPHTVDGAIVPSHPTGDQGRVIEIRAEIP